MRVLSYTLQVALYVPVLIHMVLYVYSNGLWIVHLAHGVASLAKGNDIRGE